jgi:hypothetical protein
VKPARAAKQSGSLGGSPAKDGKAQESLPPALRRSSKIVLSRRGSAILQKEDSDSSIPPAVTTPEPKVAKPRESIRKSLILMKQEIDSKIAPGEHIMEIKVKEPKASPSVVSGPVSFLSSFLFPVSSFMTSNATPPPVVPVPVPAASSSAASNQPAALIAAIAAASAAAPAVKAVVPPTGVTAQPAALIAAVAAASTAAPAVKAVVPAVETVSAAELVAKAISADPVTSVGDGSQAKAPKKRESIRASLLMIKQEIDPKVAPGEHIMEIKVKEPKPAAALAPIPEPATEPVVVKKRESIRASLLMIKQEIDPKVAPGEHIMEIKVNEPKVVAVPVTTPVVPPPLGVKGALPVPVENISPFSSLVMTENPLSTSRKEGSEKSGSPRSASPINSPSVDTADASGVLGWIRKQIL